MKVKFTFDVIGFGCNEKECLENAYNIMDNAYLTPISSHIVIENENIMDSLSILWTCPECKGLMISDMDNLEQVGNCICPDCEVEMEIKKVSIEEKN
jgi:hypothetical protein